MSQVGEEVSATYTRGENGSPATIYAPAHIRDVEQFAVVHQKLSTSAATVVAMRYYPDSYFVETKSCVCYHGTGSYCTCYSGYSGRCCQHSKSLFQFSSYCTWKSRISKLSGFSALQNFPNRRKYTIFSLQMSNGRFPKSNPIGPKG